MNYKYIFVEYQAEKQLCFITMQDGVRTISIELQDKDKYEIIKFIETFAYVNVM